MIDYLLTFDSEADAIGALPAWLDADGNWNPDTISDVRAYTVTAPATDDEPEQRDYEAGRRISILARVPDATLAAMDGAVAIDWSAVDPLAVLGSLRIEPVRAM